MLTREWLIKDVDITLCIVSETWKIKFLSSYNNLCIYTHIILRNHLISFVFLLVSETHLSILWVHWKTEKSCLICLPSVSGLLSYFSITCSGNKNSWGATRKQCWNFLIGCFSVTLAWYIDTIAYPIWLCLTLLI